MLLGSVALAAAGAFIGASLYVNLVEQPARMALDDASLAKEWEPSDRRGFVVLAGLAAFSALCGFIVFRELDDIRWLIGAIIIAASWPYAYWSIVPLNNRILALIEGEATHEAREVIKLWGLLEFGQTGLGLAALIAYLWAAS